MKKIVFVNSRLSGGGSERVMTILANYCSNHGYDVNMILVREPENPTYVVDKNVKIYQIKYKKTTNKISIFFQRIRELRKYLKKENPDIIISFMVDINITTLIAGRDMLEKVIVSERADPNSNERKKIYRYLERIFYKKCKKVVTQTDDVRMYFNRNNIYNTVTISNPINDKILQPYKGEKEKKIIAVGRLTEQKNFKLLIDAFYAFQKKHKEFVLEICGEGPLLKELKQQCANLEIEEKVIFSGFVEDVNYRMQRSYMYVSSSNFEGISNSMLEAMAMGIPTICTNCPVGGAAMVIENNKNGILVPVCNEKELINAMENIVSNQELRNSIIQKSQEVKEIYSVSKISREWEKLF